MDTREKIDNGPAPRVRIYAALLVGAWTLIVLASLSWNVYLERQSLFALACDQARTAHRKDITYRRWNAMHGGVYVPVTERTPPNPYLDVPERDITTPSGRRLTLMNPAYMTREVHDLAKDTYGIHGHITSLNPIRPENAADAWETRALQAFERGEEEVSSVEDFVGEPHMRLMRPLLTEEGCLKCHAAQGYKVGDIRGGISVSVPMAPLYASGRSRLTALYVGHGIFWAIGLAGIGLGVQRIRREIAQRRRAEDEQRKRERLQGVIEMAGAACHELSQPMQVVSGYSDLLSMQMSKEDPQYPRVMEIKDQAERMARITMKLNNITKYVTRDYIDDVKIIDIDKASETD